MIRVRRRWDKWSVAQAAASEARKYQTGCYARKKGSGRVEAWRESLAKRLVGVSEEQLSVVPTGCPF